MKKINLNYIKTNWFKLHDSIRYFIIGSINAGISYLIFAIAVLIFGKDNYQLCVALQWALSSFTSYLNQKFFVFNTVGNYVKEYCKCCSTWFLSYLLNAFLIEIFVRFLHINVYIAEAFSMLIAAVFTYTIFKLYAFKSSNVFKKNIKVRYSEMDCNLVLKPSALLQFLQDMASDNAEQLDFGYSYITKNNLAWFLLKYHIEFEKYPKGIYDLTLVTEPRGYNKLFAFRDFKLCCGNEILGRAASTWSLVDINSKNIVPIEQALRNNPNMKKYVKRNDDLEYEKIKPLKNIDFEKFFEVRFEDVDVNLHANNANYIIWAFETLDYDFRAKKVLKSLDIVFKKEVKYGSKIISQVEINDNKTNHILKSQETGEDLCMILANWVEI